MRLLGGVAFVGARDTDQNDFSFFSDLLSEPVNGFTKEN